MLPDLAKVLFEMWGIETGHLAFRAAGKMNAARPMSIRQLIDVKRQEKGRHIARCWGCVNAMHLQGGQHMEYVHPQGVVSWYPLAESLSCWQQRRCKKRVASHR